MHIEHDINLGRALAEVIFGLLIAIALHLGLPEAAVARLRARMAVTAEEWEALYTAWLAARLAPVPVHPRRTSRRKSARQSYSARRTRHRPAARVPAAVMPTHARPNSVPAPRHAGPSARPDPRQCAAIRARDAPFRSKMLRGQGPFARPKCYDIIIKMTACIQEPV
jgi:hypothetical protein